MMARVEITYPGERVVDEITALVARPTTPSTAQPPAIGLVEISEVQPTDLIPGPPGPQGNRGSRWYTGDGPPGAISGTVTGDMYLDDVTGEVWSFNGTAWIDTGTNIQGSPDTGADILVKLAPVDGAGSGLDADLLDGQHGDYYLALANGTGTISDAQHGNRGGGTLHAPATPTVAGFMTDAPNDGGTYARKNLAWALTSVFIDAPNDAQAYVRQALGWVVGYTKAAIDTLLAAKAPLASPAFTGSPSAPTQPPTTTNTLLATTAFVQANAIKRVVDRVFTVASTSWNKDTTPGLKYAFVEVQGPGGGGGGAPSSAAGQVTVGCPGGAGGYVRRWYAYADLPSGGIALTIPAGANPGYGGQAGSVGGTASFGALLTANGGSGGSWMSSGAGVAAYWGSAGGTASGGATAADNIKGGNGTFSLRYASNGGVSGNGGDAPSGQSGGLGRVGVGDGISGVLGSGGSGGVDVNAGGARYGGYGGDAFIRITEFY